MKNSSEFLAGAPPHWRDTISDDGRTLLCLEDGTRRPLLRRYLRERFGLGPDEYRRKWGLPSDYPLIAPALTRAFARTVPGARPSRAAGEAFLVVRRLDTRQVALARTASRDRSVGILHGLAPHAPVLLDLGTGDDMPDWLVRFLEAEEIEADAMSVDLSAASGRIPGAALKAIALYGLDGARAGN